LQVEGIRACGYRLRPALAAVCSLRLFVPFWSVVPLSYSSRHKAAFLST